MQRFEELFHVFAVPFVEDELLYCHHFVFLNVIAFVNLGESSLTQQLQGLIPVVDDGPFLKAVLAI